MTDLIKQIINNLKDNLQNNFWVYAFWLEGSAAKDEMDEYSDLDLWFDVKDEKVDEVMGEIEQILSEFGQLDFSYQQEKPHPQIVHKIFHIVGMPESLFLDVNIQSHSREFIFTKDMPGEETKTIFDKVGVIKFKDFDAEKFRESQESLASHLRKRFEQQARVKTLVNRGEFVDAFKYYNKYILEPLTDLTKLRYAPEKPIFIKGISRILPPDVLGDLEKLYKIHSIEDISSKIDLANKLFQKIVNEKNSK